MIYKRIAMTLPGGFKLPVSLLYSTYVYRDTKAGKAESIDIKTIANDYLCDQMVAGEILGSYFLETESDDFLVLNGRYFCREMIGKEQNEEQYKGYE